MLELKDGFVLYHGSYCEVKAPDLGKCAKRKDFGQGFYLTTSKEQAESFLRTSIAKAIATGTIEEGQKFGYISTLDALLNQKALVARNRSIDVQFRVNDLSAVKIDLVDLTVIISNTLDNAIEACEKLPVQERQIYVQVVLNDNELFYAVRNRSLPIDVSSDRLPVTTKENPSFHGYGLQNVQTTLAKYHSVYAMDYADGWFEFATDLPNTLIS